MVGLPVPLTPLVGREREIALAVDLLRRDDVRLLTITGPGGIGKTRLAVEIGRAEPIRADRDIVFVPLAAVSDADQIAAEIARVLGIQEVIGVSARESIVAALHDAATLVIIDNFEHVLSAAPLLTELLAACPRLKIATTSRALLRLAGEYALPIPPLVVPDPDTVRVPLDDAPLSPAVRLFVDRVRAVSPAFVLSDATAATVAHICRHLDGLPLAIELAAAQAAVLPPAALLARIRARLPLPVAGPRDAPARLRSLRDTVAWSYDLLTPEEQRLFRQVSIFVDGFALDAVEAIDALTTPPPETAADAAAPSHSVIELVASLVEKSLLRQSEWEGEARFHMLETIRTFALDQLEGSGEADAVGDAHAAWALALAEPAELAPALLHLERTGLLQRLAVEHANLLAALQWFKQRDDGDRLLFLSAALGGFWYVRGHFQEGRDWLERSLAHAPRASSPARGRAKVSLGFLLVLFGEAQQADHLVTDGIASLRPIEDAPIVALSYVRQASIANHLGDHDRAEHLLHHALERTAAVPDSDVATALTGAVFANLGVAAHAKGDLDLAYDRLSDALRINRERGYSLGVTRCLRDLGDVNRDRGDFVGAMDLYRECLELYEERTDVFVVVDALEGAALAAAAWGRPDQAARFLGAAEAFRESRAGVFLVPADLAAHQRALAAIRATLDSSAMDAAWASGRQLTVADAISEIRDLTPPDLASKPAERTPTVLSPRETEVLRLLVDGNPDRAIADALFLSVRTVEAHVARILGKLGVRTRTAAASAAIAAGLVAPPSPAPATDGPD